MFISVLAEGGALHVPLNEGQTQYAKALEELARISDDSTLLPKQGFLHYVKRKRERSSTMIYIGLQRNELPLLSHQRFSLLVKGWWNQLKTWLYHIHDFILLLLLSLLTERDELISIAIFLTTGYIGVFLIHKFMQKKQQDL